MFSCAQCSNYHLIEEKLIDPKALKEINKYASMIDEIFEVKHV
jgi:hypothetical protein